MCIDSLILKAKSPDPAKRRLPAGTNIAKVLRRIWDRQQADVLVHVRANGSIPRLTKWTAPMVQSLAPQVRPIFLQGGHQAATRIRGLLSQSAKGRKVLRLYVEKRTVNPPHPPLVGTPVQEPPDVLFNELHPHVPEAINRITFDFCQATNQTTSLLLATAHQRLREELLAGMQQGEAIRKLADRVVQIFQDPMRAYRIARTEASRAVHAGQVLAAKESQVVKGLQWLAKSDACPICLDLNGEEVELDEDFAYDAGRGAYSRVPHPPRHVHCTCTVLEVLKDQYQLAA